MADKKVTALTAATSSATADLAHIITAVATGATNKKSLLQTSSPKFQALLVFRIHLKPQLMKQNQTSHLFSLYL